MGAEAVKVDGVRGLEAELARKPARRGPRILVVDTEAVTGAGVGGGWWDVVVPEVGDTESLRANWKKSAEWTPAMAAPAREASYRRWKKAVQRTLDWVDDDDG